MNRVFFIVIILFLVLVGIWFFRGSAGDSASTPTSLPSPTPSKLISPTPLPSRTGFIGPNGLTQPGNCSLSGSIEFITKDTFASHDAKIVYQNIDSDARLITWRVSPNDSLIIGPNIIGVLPLPDGNSGITVKLPDNPLARSYTLTVTVGYGEITNNNVVIKEARCTGSIPIRLRF